MCKWEQKNSSSLSLSHLAVLRGCNFLHAVNTNSMQYTLIQFYSVIDNSLDLEKISRRNDSYFSLSSWRIIFSFLFLFSIFKILRPKFSFSSPFVRCFKRILLLLSIFKIVKKNSLSTLDLWDLVHCFSFSSCEKCFIF